MHSEIALSPTHPLRWKCNFVQEKYFQIEIVVECRQETFCSILAATAAGAECGLRLVSVRHNFHIILHFTCHCSNLILPSVSHFHTTTTTLARRQFNADLSRYTFTTLKARHHRRLPEWQKSRLLFYSKHTQTHNSSSTSMCISIFCKQSSELFWGGRKSCSILCHFCEERQPPHTLTTSPE